MSKSENLYIETKLENWNDLFKLNQKFLSKFIFRGQANKEWKLSTALERQIDKFSPNLYDKDTIPIQERYMLKEFKWKYPLYSNKQPEENNTVEWLTIMQHYGTATRLLDFSYSLFVALHMAVYDNGNSGALWAINKIPINHHLFDQYRKEFNTNSESQEKLDLFTLKRANEIINMHSFDKDIEKQLFIIKPQFCNERLSRQQGLFLLPSSIKIPFLDCLNTYLHSPTPIEIPFDKLIEYSHEGKHKQEDISLIKIVIPREKNYILTKNLKAMNVTTEILFPGLEGLAKSLNYAQFCFNYGEDE